ncbi:MAG: ABC transporter substrate-binding protein [Bacteroidota bacterium]
MRLIRFLPLLLPFLFSFCSGPPEADQDMTVFRYNESKGIATLDPAFAKSQTLIWPVHQLFNGLVQMDSALNVQPCIAKSWDISDDGKTYTFHLRNDVYFHDHHLFPDGEGRKVKASDFVYSLKRTYAPETASPGAWIFNYLDKKKGPQAINDSILQIHLKRPFPAFLGLLTMKYCSVVPREIVEHYGDEFGRHPVGTGPFHFKMWREGEKLIFRKNPHYFEKDDQGNRLPYLDAVSITFISDKQSEFLEFIKGDMDFLSGLSPANKNELLTRTGQLNPKYKGEIKMYTQPYLNTEYLGFLVDDSMETVQNSPASDKLVRKAINYGFDRTKMMKYLRNNIGTPANNGFIPKGLPAFSKDSIKGYTYNPDKARSLLKKAGHPQGEGLSTIKLTTTDDYKDLCEFIQHQLSDIGIKINIEVSTGATFRDMVANSKLLFFRGSWIADYPDAENYMALFYSENFSPGGPNYTHYENPEYDRLYEKALNTMDAKKRQRYYRQMDRMIIEDAPIVPLYYDQVVRFTRTNIKGLGNNPMNLLVLKHVKKEKNETSRQ